uniref:RRM domain-containing protein n=1 Tax=Scophthalmus maximus TaxID=52904 RepID=A0A8D3CPT0_SCOMX
LQNRQLTPNEPVLNLERVQVLETWLQMTNMTLTQVNGQRKYGGPPEAWDGPAPGAHCEVFISQIPRDVYEDLLIPLFSSVGPLWEFRLMMNFSGQNRGFAYAKYSSPGVAADTIRLLHGHVLGPGLRLSVRRSIEKRHLCISDLPATTRLEDLLRVLRVLVQGVEGVSLSAGPGAEGVSAIVTFSSHQAASMAKRTLVEAFKNQFALTVSVKWQSTVKLGPDRTLPPRNPSKSLLAPPMKPPCHILTSPRSCSVLPLHLARHSSVPPGFCRAVVGPTLPPHPHPSCSYTFSSPSQGLLQSAPSSAMPLLKVLEVTGVGQPLLNESFFRAEIKLTLNVFQKFTSSQMLQKKYVREPV